MTDSKVKSQSVGFAFGDFALDVNAAVLRGPDGEMVLEPRVCELLVFLCENPDRVLGRDEIVEAVWRGGIVSDNAVSKLVARLRRDLGDDPKASRYVQTLSRRGYRFVASVAPLVERPEAARRARGGRGEADKSRGLLGAAILVIVALAAGIAFFPRPEATMGPLPIAPLTREPGTEFSPAISPDGHLLGYTHRRSARESGTVRMKDLRTGEAMPAPSDQPAGRLVWSPDGRHLAALQRVDGRCVVRLLPVDQAGEPVELMDCGRRLVSELVFSADGAALYFTSRSRPYQPMEIFELDVATGSTTLITQPPLVGAGNYGIDLSPDGRGLLILSADNSYQSRLHVLDLESGALTTHGSFDHSIERAIWHHDGASIVHLAAPLAYELVRSGLNGERLETIVSTASRITEFARHPNGVDFHFASFQMNNDLLIVEPESGTEVAGDNTSVYEHLPRLSGGGNTYLFLSNRTGVTQVFEARVDAGGARQVTQFPDSRVFVSLDLSPDERSFLLATYNELLVLDRETGAIRHRAKAEGLILAAGWFDDSALAVSLLDQYVERLYRYDLPEAQWSAQPERWIAALVDGTNQFRVERGGGVYRQIEGEQWRETGLILQHAFFLTGLNLRTDRDLLYYETGGALTNQIIRFDPSAQEPTLLGEYPYVSGFDVAGNRLILSQEVDRTGDIVVTRAGGS